MQVGTGNEERIYDVAKNVTKELNLQREESHILDATQEAPETGGISVRTSIAKPQSWVPDHEFVGITRMDPRSEPSPVDFSTG